MSSLLMLRMNPRALASLLPMEPQPTLRHLLFLTGNGRGEGNVEQL